MQYTYKNLYMINIYAHSCVHIGFFSCSPLTIERSCCLSSPIFLLLNPKIYHLGHGYRILVVLLPNILFSSLLTNYRSLLTAHRSQDSTPRSGLLGMQLCLWCGAPNIYRMFGLSFAMNSHVALEHWQVALKH
jgi:hypothetical protein